jgi:hypothetical protein
MELALGCFAGATGLRADRLSDLISHLADSQRAVRQADATLALPSMGTPDSPGPFALPELAEVDWCRATVAVEPNGWIVAEAALVPDLDLTARADAAAVLDRMQEWTRAGKYVVTPAGQVRVEVRTPVLDEDFTGRVAWTTSQATLMLQVGARQLSA